MEQVVKCNSLSAIYRNNNLILGGPHLIQFDTMQDNQIHIDKNRTIWNQGNYGNIKRGYFCV